MFAEYLNAESGAVSVDWTVLTAFLCGLAIAMITMLSASAQEPTSALNAVLADDVIGNHDSFE